MDTADDLTLPFTLEISMNIKRFFPLAFIAVMAMSSSGSLLAANIVGDTTAQATSGAAIVVGESNVDNPSHTSGLAGIGIPGFGQPGDIVDFQGLASLSNATEDLGNGLIHYALYDYSAAPPSHQDLGRFDFVKVASADVWFGTWSEHVDANGNGSGNYQAYYAGDSTGTSLPTGQTATYTLAGLNGANVLTGTLNATFGGDNTLTGTLFNSSVTIDIEATINSDASFTGAALANTGDDVLVGGDSRGHFFGQDAAFVAGVADFGASNSLNTAFGGTKNP